MNARNVLFSGAACIGLSLAAGSLQAQSWTPTSAPTNGWFTLGCSADGTRLVAAGHLCCFTSTNSGATWTSNNLPNRYWYCVAASADGTRWVAGTAWEATNALYRSTNSGQTWSELTGTPEVRWMSLTCSADGTKLAAGAIWETNFGGAIYTSTNSGATWTSNSPTLNSIYWNAVASSADGSRLVAASANGSPAWPAGERPFGPIYTSSDSGATWLVSSNARAPWRSVACSADGVKLIAGADSGAGFGTTPSRSVYVSTNGGVTWTAITNIADEVVSVASSADGSSLLAGGMNVYVSGDSGATWTVANVPPTGFSGSGFSAASSADGSKRFAADGGLNGPGGIYTSQSVPAPTLELVPSGPDLLVTWIVPSRNFVLQQKSDLARGQWSDVADSPAFNPANIRFELPVSCANPRMFYRLAGR